MSFLNQQEPLLNYQRQGQGTPLLLLHGFCEDSQMWEAWKQPFLAHFQVITVDLPGFGRSPLQLTQPSIAEMAKAVHALLDHLDLERVHLLGHSMGGYVALSMAAQRPERSLSLTLFHSHPFADGEEKKRNREKSMDFIRRHGTVPFVSQLMPSLFAPSFLEQNRAFVQDFIAQNSEHHSDALLAATHAMLHRPDQSEVLRQAEFPVLFMVGKQDKAIPKEQNLAQLTLPKVARIELYHDLGHMGMWENPKATQYAFLRFLYSSGEQFKLFDWVGNAQKQAVWR
jgi:pimeloyl-ACP methyl ester carboxylesterase